MNLKKIENPWELSHDELQKRCVKVKTGDGVLRDVGFHFDGGYATASVYASPGMIEVRRHGWHLLGWTFYEKVEPLVWEGECVMHRSPFGTRLESSEDFPGGKFFCKRFHVVATEIVEDEDAEA